MKSIRRLAPIVAGVIGVTGAWGVAGVGCGSSNSSAPGQDSGVSDATTDSEQPDVAAEVGPGPDAPVGDTGPGVDSNSPAPDTGVAVDSSTPDTGTIEDSAIVDSGIADGDGGFNVVAASFAFNNAVAAAMCNQYAACCGTSGDASTFNWTACFNTYGPQGFHGSSNGTNLIANGNITFNPALAQACLNAIASVDCSTNQLTAAESVQLYASCFGAYAGTLPNGAACGATVECAPGEYCLPVDGGVGDAGAIGICQPLAGDGGACGNLGNQGAGQTECSYRGAATNGLFCQNIEADAANTQIPASTWTCQPQWGAGAGCWTNQDCTSYICHEYSSTDYQCASAGNWSNASICAAYLLDGG